MWKPSAHTWNLKKPPHDVDAATYQRRFLKRKLWDAQRRMCAAVDRSRLISVKACHASGKTFNAAGLVPWWLNRSTASKVITIAPTLRQVKLIWEEISLALEKSPIRWPEPTVTSLRLSKENYAIGFSSAKGVNAQGFHGQKVLIIADEAPGIPPDVWDAIEGIRAGGDVRLLKLGNPVVPSGPFFDDFNTGKAVTECITISAFDTPNLLGITIEQLLAMDEEALDFSVNPYLVTRRWVKERYLKWGPNHPSYQARVLGQFPAQGQFSVFSAALVSSAARPLTEEQLTELETWDGTIQVGIDVAGAGDDETAACARAGNVVVAAGAWVDADARGPCAVFLTRLKLRFPKARILCMVDVLGVGYHFATWLADQGYEVYGFYASGEPQDKISFLNAKAEAYWTMRDWMVRGIYGVEDLDTQAQLIGIQFKPLPRGQIMIEPKKDAKKRGMGSPDRAEALVMAYVTLAPKFQRVVTGQNYGEVVQISPY